MKTLHTLSAPFSLRLAVLVVLLAGLAACQSLPEADNRPAATDKFVLSSPDQTVVGQLRVVIARHEDTLPDIARRFNLGYEEIVAANPTVDPWLPGEGTRVVLPTQFILPAAPHEGVVLNLAALRLFYFPEPAAGEAQTVITHPVGIGREGWSTPLVTTKVIKKTKAPVWYVPASIRREHAAKGDPLPSAVPPGPDNPLGTHALRLALPSYLIHGTNKPYGIGMRVSHGCIQLYPEDIESIYQLVPVGTPVRIVNQPFLAGWHAGTLYLEVHPPLEDDKRNKQKMMRAALEAEAAKGPAGSPPVDWDKANRLMNEPRGLALPVLVGDPGTEAVLADARLVENAVPSGANYREEPATRAESQPPQPPKPRLTQAQISR